MGENVIDAIKKKRKLSKMTIKNLSAKTGINERTIYMMEHSGNPTLKTIEKVCDALGEKLIVISKK